jgi:hypothetical protein
MKQFFRSVRLKFSDTVTQQMHASTPGAEIMLRLYLSPGLHFMNNTMSGDLPDGSELHSVTKTMIQLVLCSLI